ncbi:HlyD family efflux transporter periplasmic adaptor subunit [Paraburkholderia sacchari]|uniref:HlyD family efflux transporter periplasmic adaptor subunit n=1 Tax=Paraburkholderia sacchari TaxID=159450 RepID=UPI003D954D93
MSQRFAPVTRWLFTSLLVLGSILVVAVMWHRYQSNPWTRNARVSAHIVRIAPEVSGPVIEVRVTANQHVHQDDILYVINPERFHIAVAAAQAAADARKQEMLACQTTGAHWSHGRPSATSGHLRTSCAAEATAWQEARTARDQAQFDLARTTVRSPIDGYVANLQLRPGDYASAGQTNLTMIEAEGFWITGYFEETKLQHIQVGSAVQIRLMSTDQPLTGHVASIGRGIADENDSTSNLGLPNIEPVFSWVRLAQRIPVRIRIDHVPHEVELVAGMSATVTIETNNYR